MKCVISIGTYKNGLGQGFRNFLRRITYKGSKGSKAEGNGPGEAKADIEEAVAGRVEVAIRRPAVPRSVDPAAAVHHAVRASKLIDPGTSIIRRTFMVIVPIIVHPFPHIAMHVIENETI